MSDFALTAIVTPLFSAVIGALVGAFVAAIKKTTAQDKEREEQERAERRAEKKALRTLLRNELVSMHREWVEEKGCITLEALEYAEDTYESYHGLDGNGSGTKLWDDLKALPIKR